MNKHRTTAWIGAMALSVTGLLAIPSMIKAADVADSEQVSKLLSDAKTQAFQLKEDASAMESYTRSAAGWETHAATVEQMKEHINAAGRTLVKLDENRKNASPWQATAIDRIKPVLKEISANAEAVIQYLNKNPKRLATTEYRDYIEANADLADKLAGLVSDFVDYGNAKSRMERLATKLELPKT